MTALVESPTDLIEPDMLPAIRHYCRKKIEDYANSYPWISMKYIKIASVLERFQIVQLRSDHVKQLSDCDVVILIARQFSEVNKTVEITDIAYGQVRDFKQNRHSIESSYPIVLKVTGNVDIVGPLF
jgi:hypothetical protein